MTVTPAEIEARKAFEAWMVRTSGQFNFSPDDSDEYRNLAVRECWDIWQSSRRAALEEAAMAYRAKQSDRYPRGCDAHAALVAAVDTLSRLDAAGGA